MWNRKTYTNFVLLTLEKAVDGYVRFDDLIHHSGRYAYSSGWDKPLNKSSLAQALKRLREKGFIEKIDNKNEAEIVFKLTQIGNDYLLTGKSEDEIEWDGKWRIVVFDIPEKRRVIRDILRSRLKMWGFSLWQQSVWASKKNLTEKLNQLIKDLNIGDWVLIIESDNVGR